MNLHEVKSKFTEFFKQSPDWVIRAPASISLLGEYLGFDDGINLSVTLDHSIIITGHLQTNNLVSINNADNEEIVSFSLDQIEDKIDLNGNPLPSWALYPAGITWALKRAGFNISGLNVFFTSNIPFKTIFSSNGPLGVAIALLWQVADKLKLDRSSILKICQKAEVEYIGRSFGLYEKLSIAFGVEKHAMLSDNRDFTWQPIPLPKEIALVIFDTGSIQEFPSYIYNDLRASLEKAVISLKDYLPDLQSLRDVPPTEFAALSYFLPDLSRKRAEHVVKEIARVQSAVRALQRNDNQAFGALLYAGHKSLSDLYDVSTPEIDALVELSRQSSACLGARITGIETGGVTINLVKENRVNEFIHQIKQNYTKKTGKKIQAHLCKTGQGAEILNI